MKTIFAVLFGLVGIAVAPAQGSPAQGSPAQGSPAQGSPAQSSESQSSAGQDPKAPLAVGQEPTDETKQGQLGPRMQEYMSRKRELRGLEDQVTQKLASASLGNSRNYDVVMKQIEDLRRQKLDKAGEILAASVEAYMEAPGKYEQVTSDVTRYMRSLLGEQSTSGHFSPSAAVDVAKRIISTGPKNSNIYLYGAQAAYCLNDFELAKAWFAEMEKNGTTPDPEILKQVTECVDKWARELKLREADAQSILPQVLIKTDIGDITIELFENEAPNTVSNFIQLVEKKYYDGLPFFFCRPGRLALTGCKTGDGKSNAGYYIADEAGLPEIRHHFAGCVAMTQEKPNTSSAIFAILQQPTPDADGKRTVFGRVIQGLDVVNSLPPMDPASIAAGDKPITIVSATVLRKKSHPYEATTLPLSDAGTPGK